MSPYLHLSYLSYLSDWRQSWCWRQSPAPLFYSEYASRSFSISFFTSSSYHNACSYAIRFLIFLLFAQAFTWGESTKNCSISTKWNLMQFSRIFEKICIFESAGVVLSKSRKMRHRIQHAALHQIKPIYSIMVLPTRIRQLLVSAKYSCGFPDPQVLPIIVVDRYLDYFTTIMEDRLWQVLAKPVSRWRNRSGLSMNAVRAA